MRRVIYLAQNEPRCVPSACGKILTDSCARKDVTDHQGRLVADFSVPGGAHVPDCWLGNKFFKFIPYSKAVKPPEAKTAREWIGR